MEGRSLPQTPTWAVASVVTLMVTVGLFFHASLKYFWKWLKKTKRKALSAALDKIKDELMVFGVMSLLMGHAIGYAAKICVKSPVLSDWYFMCGSKSDVSGVLLSKQRARVSNNDLNTALASHKEEAEQYHRCPKGHEPFASSESLEQLHRLMFVLAVTHVTYSFTAVALAIAKISSWRSWENHAKSLTSESKPDVSLAVSNAENPRRRASFIIQHASHPWSQHRIFVWLLCFIRQFWSSINESDYMALRLGFMSTHQLPLTYDFHSYMLRSMEEEFHNIVGISIPLWIYAILCIFLEFHDTTVYFWLSFAPAILILLIGTKLHHVVVKLAIEIIACSPSIGPYQFNLRDDLFWFGKPQLLLWLIQLISFQNAFEMAAYIWSMWEINDSSCFMDNRTFMVIRLVFGVMTQVWCSYITFPLYVIVTQMGSRFKKSVISENVRRSLSEWEKRVRNRTSVSSRKSTSVWRFKTLSTDSSSSHSSDEASCSKGMADEETMELPGMPLWMFLYGHQSKDDEDDVEENETP